MTLTRKLNAMNDMVPMALTTRMGPKTTMAKAVVNAISS